MKLTNLLITTDGRGLPLPFFVEARSGHLVELHGGFGRHSDATKYAADLLATMPDYQTARVVSLYLINRHADSRIKGVV